MAITEPVTASLSEQEARLAAVRRYEILDAPTDGAFDDIAELAALTFGTPIATVTIVDSERVWFAATKGLDGVTEIGADPGLCASAVLTGGPYIVNDAEADPRTLNHPLVRGDLGLRFYAAAPITTSDGFRLGTVNVIDREPREVTGTQTAILTRLADVVARQLELRLAAIVAVRAERRLQQEADERAAKTRRVAERLREAAALHGEEPHPEQCQLGGRMTPCDAPAELKIADPWGDSAWGCNLHVEEALINVKSVFLADRELSALAAYRDRR